MSTAPAPELLLRDVGYRVGPRDLLQQVTLALRPGTMVAISGPSGAGKTTLLSVMGGLLEPSDGEATYRGLPVWTGTGDPRPQVAFVLQVYGLVPILTALENVSVALRARGVKSAEADERALAELARFHISDLADRQVDELSGGQRQRVALARALVCRSEVILADEPSSELDETNAAHVVQQLRVEAERGAVVVVATHDEAVVDVCDEHHVIDEGRLTTRVAPVAAAMLHRSPHNASTGPHAGEPSGASSVAPADPLGEAPGFLDDPA